MTSNEIQQQTADAGDSLDLFPPAQQIQPQAFVQLEQTVEAMRLAGRFAAEMCKTTAVPDIYRIAAKVNERKTADEVVGNAAAAVIYGLEIGLTPTQALQNVFPVGGKPSIYARTAAALLKRRGYRFETVRSTDEVVVVRGYSPDGVTVEECEWTFARAEKAGYVPTIDPQTQEYRKNKWGKLIGNEKYLTDPQAMLYGKALMEACRKLAPDVLLGIADSDDAHLFDGEDETPRRVQNTAPAQNNDLRARLAGKPIVDEPQAEDAPTPADEPTPPVEETAPTGTADEPQSEPNNQSRVDSSTNDTDGHPGDESVADDGQPADEPQAAETTSGAEEEESKPEAQADPEPAQTTRAVPPVTKLQLSKLWTVLGKEGLTDRDQALEWIGSQLQREVASTKELTKTEAAQLIDFLEKAQAADAAKGTQ